MRRERMKVLGIGIHRIFMIAASTATKRRVSVRAMLFLEFIFLAE